MPDIFCHQEPQTQMIKCQKSAKFFLGGSNFHHLFMSYIFFEIYYFLIDPVKCWPFRPLFFGTLVLWFLAFLVIWPQISNSQLQKAINNTQQPSTAINHIRNAPRATPKRLRKRWYPKCRTNEMAKGRATALPQKSNTQQNTCFFAVHVPVDSFGGIRFKLESTHFFQGVPVEISGGHIGIWLRLLLRDFNSMLPTLPLWQAAHCFGSEPNKNRHSMALKVRLQLWFSSNKNLFLVTFHPCPG